MPFGERERQSTSIAKGTNGRNDAAQRHEGHQFLPLSARAGGNVVLGGHGCGGHIATRS